MKGAGYDRKYAQNRAETLWNNVEITKQIDRLQAKTELNTDMSRNYLVTRLKKIVDKETSTDRDVISAASGIADLCGYKRDPAPNEEREAQRQAKVDDEARALAELRTKQISDGPRLSKSG